MDKKANKSIEETSYQFLFFILGTLCLLTSMWAWGDELFTRRPWKAYQKEYYKEEFKKAEEELSGVTAKITDKRNELAKEIERVSQKINENDVYQELKGNFIKTTYQLSDVKQEVKFAKSRLDEAYYFYKHALHEGEHWEPKKEVVDEIQEEIDSHSPQIASLTKQKDEMEAELKSFTEPKAKLEKELVWLNSDVDLLKLKMGGFKKSLFMFDFYKIPEVFQVVIRDSDINNFREPLLRVERCMSCHMSYDNPGYEKHEQPLTSHPNLEVFIEKHPTSEFGCTFCHKGQGVAISSVWQAHGHMHHEGDQTIGQNEPLLEGDFQQSNCRMCHEDAVELEHAPVLTKGKKLFKKLGCHGCHLVQGYSNLDKVGPGLKRIASKVNPSWLYRWVKKPKDYLPKARMPYFGLTEKEAMAVTAYLINQSDKDYQPALEFNPTSDAEKGRLLFEKLGCLGCHTVNGKGGNSAPDLSKVANKANADWVYNWVLNPKKYNPNTVMPSIRLSETEAGQITTYLMTLGGVKGIAGIEDKIQSLELIALGEKTIRRRGCFACHEINGMEKEGRIAPELTTFGNKRLLELEFGDSHIEKNWESWARTKLKTPAAFKTERVLDKMPNFGLAEEEIDALVVFLKSLNGARIPDKLKHHSERTDRLEEGLQLIRKYNCRGCHTLAGKGGRLAPLLDSEGERVQTKYLFDFLANPKRIRPATLFPARMPSFDLTQEEVVKLVRYFKTYSTPLVDEPTGGDIPPDLYLIEGRKVSQAFECEGCEVQDWLKNIPPGGLMPDHLPVKGEDKRVTNGRRLFWYYCASCHGHKGKGDGFNSAYLDPQPRDLTDQKEVYMAKQKNESLFKVITYGGKSIDKSPRMPPFGNTLSEKERWEIIAFVRTLHSYEEETIDFEKEGFDTKRPKTVVKRISSDRFQNVKRKDIIIGKTLFKKLGCSACHTIGEQGGRVGPELTHIGARLNSSWVYRFIKSPQSILEDVIMPNYGLSDNAALRLTHYLLSLK